MRHNATTMVRIMQDNITFKENIQKLKESTSIKKWFKKTNPNVKLCLLVLPKRLQQPINFILASVEKDIFYQKNLRSDIWSKKSISAYDIMSFCSNKFHSETTSYYYNEIIRELIDLNVIYEYRYCYSKKYNITIRLFTMEQKIYQWKKWDPLTPILPTTAIRIIRSNHEVCKKTCCIIRQINKNFTIEKSMLHFANYVYKKFITKMSCDIFSVIKPFKELKKEMNIYEYLNSYLLNELRKFDKFYGIKDDIFSKINEENPELINKILDLNKSVRLAKAKERHTEKTLVAHEKEVISINENSASYKRHSACSSIQKNAVNVLNTNELEKTAPFGTDIRDYSYKDSLNNNKNNNNKEYNDNVKKKEKHNLNGKKADNLSTNKKQGLKKMKSMSIKDIKPKNESLKKQKKNRKIKISSGEKKYRSHKDGWIFNGLTGKILGSRKDFVTTFKKIIKKYHEEIVFNNYCSGFIPREMSSAGLVMDDLVKRDCNDDAIVLEWMEWYAQVYLNNKRLKDSRFLSIEFMRKTWDMFNEVRRKDVLITSPSKNIIMDENSISFRIDRILNNDYSDESILKALRFFGVLVVSNYLQSKFGESYNVVTKIDSVFRKIGEQTDNESVIVSIFNSTCKFLCDFTNTKNTILTNWIEKYSKFWKLGKCNFTYYQNNNILIGLEKIIAEEFFRKIYDTMGTK